MIRSLFLFFLLPFAAMAQSYDVIFPDTTIVVSVKPEDRDTLRVVFQPRELAAFRDVYGERYLSVLRELIDGKTREVVATKETRVALDLSTIDADSLTPSTYKQRAQETRRDYLRYRKRVKKVDLKP